MNDPHPSLAAPIDGTQFNDLVKAVGAVKIKLSRPLRGLGKRASVPIVISFADHIIELFCEACVLESKPEDPAIGYTAEDVYFFQGVLLFTKDRDDVAGEVLELENFLTKYVDEPAVRVFLRQKMDELEQAATLDEEALHNIDMMYMNREVGEKIVDLKVH